MQRHRLPPDRRSLGEIFLHTFLGFLAGTALGLLAFFAVAFLLQVAVGNALSQASVLAFLAGGGLMGGVLARRRRLARGSERLRDSLPAISGGAVLGATLGGIGFSGGAFFLQLLAGPPYESTGLMVGPWISLVPFLWLVPMGSLSGTVFVHFWMSREHRGRRARRRPVTSPAAAESCLPRPGPSARR